MTEQVTPQAPQTEVAEDHRKFAGMLHILGIGNIFLPMWIVQIIMWLVKRGESDFIDTHGKVYLNFFLSFFIYSIVVALLTAVTGGLLFPLFFILVPVYFVCQVVGAIKGFNRAGEGVVYAKYPLSIRMLKV